jgi:hypothetical protein
MYSRLQVIFRLARRKMTCKEEKYHAAGHPEPACPELVEGSKGRLQLLLRKPE